MCFCPEDASRKVNGKISLTYVGFVPIPVTVTKELATFLSKAFTNHHHPLLQDRSDRPNTYASWENKEACIDSRLKRIPSQSTHHSRRLGRRAWRPCCVVFEVALNRGKTWDSHEMGGLVHLNCKTMFCFLTRDI